MKHKKERKREEENKEGKKKRKVKKREKRLKREHNGNRIFFKIFSHTHFVSKGEVRGGKRNDVTILKQKE